MSVGRKPKPTLLKKLHGNPGRRPINQDEPMPVGDLITAPAWMSEEQRAGWDYAIRHSPPGLLRMIDRANLTAFIVAEDLHAQACRFQSQVGLLVRAGKAPEEGEPDVRPLIQSPFLPIINRQASLMVKAAGELGFTPASRTRVGTSSQAASMTGEPMTIDGVRPVALDDYLASAPKLPIIH